MRQITVKDSLFRALIQNSSDIITILSPAGIVLYESPSVEKVTGFTSEELTNRLVFDFIHPDDIESVSHSFQAVLKESHKRHHSEFRFLTKSGDWCHLEVIGTNLLHDPNVNGIVINSRDITDRKKYEKALEKSEAKFRSLIENSSDIILIISENGHISFKNRSVHEPLFQEAITLGTQIQSLIHPNDLEQFIEKINEISQGTSSSFVIELRLKNQHKHWNILEMTGINLLGDPSVNGILINARDITQRKRDEEQLYFLAWKDPLTLLFNRAYFSQCLENQFERKKRDSSYYFALIFLDLDRFKFVNDSFGHAAGDQLLQQVSQRLKKCVRPLDIIARFGGDEFSILLSDVAEISQVMHIAERINKVLRSPFLLDGKEVFSSASMGIAVSSHNSNSPDELLRDADTALYRAKENGGARYEIFDQEMHNRAVNFLRIETDLRKALDSKGLELNYQPIFCIKTKRLVGMEALLRWNHAIYGKIAPSSFIPIAEETGLIEELGSWALQQACTELKAWDQIKERSSDLYVSVNLSTRQFKQPRLVEMIQQTLAERQIDPTRLCLEITESILMDDPESAAELFIKLRNVGTRIFMDDFGTGYSSLSYLQRFPIDTLKIDRSFISSLNQETSKSPTLENLEITKAITSLAKNLNIKVIAEGIEEAIQVQLLNTMSCDYGQGFWFSKPLSSSQARLFIHECSKVH